MPIIYFVLTQTGTIPSRVFKYATKDEYNHLSISLTQDLSLLYSFARRQSYNLLDSGFIQECLMTGTFARFPETTCKIYRYQLTDQEFNTLVGLVEQFKQDEKRYSYNFIGLLLMYFGISFTREYHYLCSQFVGFLLNELEIELPKPYQLFKPIDIENLKGIELHYEGLLHQYPDKQPANFNWEMAVEELKVELKVS